MKTASFLLPAFFLGFTIPDLVGSLTICTKVCFDQKPICAINTRGLMMEFKSPCYMINHNLCYGTDYETINLGLCPRPQLPPEPTITYHSISDKDKKQHN